MVPMGNRMPGALPKNSSPCRQGSATGVNFKTGLPGRSLRDFHVDWTETWFTLLAWKLNHANAGFLYRAMRSTVAKLGPRVMCLLSVCLLSVRLGAARGAWAQSQSNSPPQTSSQTVQTPQQTDQAAPTPEDSDSDPLTLFPHSESSRYWISGQANSVFQWHPTFPAKYTGPNSLTPISQSATTHILTLYTGYELTSTTEVFADAEYATGGGIGTANGLAGYTNLDSVRTVQGVPLAATPYLARLMLRQIIPLSDEPAKEERDELHLATSVPARRVEFRIGKMDLVDFFDVNTWGSDSHFQFLNWTVDDNGAYDYAANTRGYTDGAIVEYDDHWFTARFGEMMMPKVANGINLDADLARARSENLEFQARGNRIAHRPGVVRLLSYVNHANMGNYREAVTDYLDGKTVTPNIVSTRQQGRHKYGFG